MMDLYDDIINLPHHVSERHPQMSMYNRAAQFAPFAALTGHDSAITEAARLTDAEQELSESEAEILDRKLARLQTMEEKTPVTVTYFVPDSRKDGGSCHTVTGIIKRIDPDKGLLQFEDGPEIPIIRIKDIDGECFLTE